MKFILIFFKIIRRLASIFKKNIIFTARFNNLVLEFPVYITCDDLNAIELGKNVLIDHNSEIVICNKKCFYEGFLKIGDNSVIGSFSNIRAAGGKIILGENVLIAQKVSLIASNHIVRKGSIYKTEKWDTDKTDVIIGNNVWIGANVVVLPGCTIGDNSVIGANSVVTKSIPSDQVWAGNPAVFIKNIL